LGPPRLDEGSLARYFAPEEPVPGRTFFAEIQSLPPGQALEVTPAAVRQWTCAVVAAGPRIRYRRDDDYVEHFREILGRAVTARLRAVGPPAVMMSGGLDSTAVAAMAAPRASERGEQLRAVSYVFDELETCDERRYIGAVVERSRLAATAVVGDGEWPLRDVDSWPRNPSTPLEGPYRRLRERVYSVAAQLGTRVLLTGEFGDELYAGGEYWLADLLREGRLASVFGGLAADRYWRANGRRPRIYSLRGAIGRALGRTSNAFTSPQRPWLTLRGAAFLGPEEPAPNHGTRPSQWRTLLHQSAGLGNGTEPYHAARRGLEIRRPFRDRRLIEFALAIPAHLLYRPGDSKWILRRAMRGVLPEEVRTRRHPTSLQPLFARGLGERARREAEDSLFDKDALWRPYVREEWLRETFPRCLSGPDGAGLVAVWRCICVEQWRRGLVSRGLGGVGVLTC
jgi:asparagine synthase (glutamine-hydrolysing)